MRDRIRSAALITVASLLFIVPLSVADTPEPYTLENGLTVILRPVPTAAQVACVVLFNLGVVHDPIGKSGMTHMMEHLYVTAAAGDTPARSSQAFMKRYPAGWNAQTGFDFTVIAGIVESATLENELRDVAARMSDLRITETDVAREMPRVVDELRNMYGGIPWLAGLNHTRSRLYPFPQGGQYGGTPEQVETFTLKELRQFWTDYYKPNNVILIIAGKFDATEVRKSIAENFGQVTPGKPPPLKLPASTAKTGELYRVNVKSLVKNGKRVAAIGYAPPSVKSADYAPFLIVVSRLWTQLQPPRQNSKVQPIYYAPLVDPTTFALQMELSDEADATLILEQLNQHLQTALTEPLTPQDRQLAVSSVARSFGKLDVPTFMWSQNLYGFALIVGRQYQMRVQTQPLVEALAQVTDADLQRLGESVFAPEKQAAVIIELEK